MIANEGSGVQLPKLTNPAAASDLLIDKQLIDAEGNVIAGEMPIVTHPNPTIVLGANGLITVSHVQESGKVTGGITQATQQLTIQNGTTITPGTSQQTAVASGRYTTGPVYVAGDSNLKAANIKAGVNIFGISGNYSGTTVKVKTGEYNGSSEQFSTFYANIDSGAKGLIGVMVKSHALHTLQYGQYPQNFPVSTSFVTFMRGFTTSSSPASFLNMDGFITFSPRQGVIGYGRLGAPEVPDVALRVGLTSDGRVNFNYGFDGSSRSLYYAGGDIEYTISYTIIYAV